MNALIAGAVEIQSYENKKGQPKERAGRLRLAMIDQADAVTINGFLNTNVKKGSIVRTDGWKGYSKDALLNYKHDAHVVQGSGRKAHQLAPHIHRTFSNLKTWLQGTHHGVNPKYLQGYLDEFVFRFNRRQTPMAVFRTLLGITAQKDPMTLSQLKA